MGQSGRIDELVQQWKAHYDQGCPVTMEQLCQACPELLPELRTRIAALFAERVAVAAPIPADGEKTERLPGMDAEKAVSVPTPDEELTLPPHDPEERVEEKVDKDEEDSGDLTLPPTGQRGEAAQPPPVDPRNAPDTIADDAAAQMASRMPWKASRYRILDEIARGGMGVVLRALDPIFGRTLAVKVMLRSAHKDPEARKRFLDEAQITGQLQHPGVAPVHELGCLEDGRMFFAMRLIEGQTLADLLKERTSRTDAEKSDDKAASLLETLPRFLNIFEQVCQTLAYAHAQNIIHRDLKPDNVMVGAFGEVQVMDWGLAKKLVPKSVKKKTPVPAPAGTDDDKLKNVNLAFSTDIRFDEQAADEDSHTQEGEIMGTPAYMAPEQARGEIDRLDQRTDVFGLGAILCMLLTGKPAFAAKDPMDVMLMAVEGNLQDAVERLNKCGADKELLQIAKHCLAPRKKDRPKNAGEVAEAIAAHQSRVRERLRQAELDRAQAQIKATSERTRRRLTLGLAAAVLLLGIGTGIAIFWFQHLRAQQAYEQQQQRVEDSIRKARDAHATRNALGQVYDLVYKGLFGEATSLLEETRFRIDGVNNFPLHQQLEETSKDIQLAARLDEIRMTKASGTRHVQHDQAARAYAKAFFKTHRVLKEGEAAETAAKRFRESRIKQLLLDALDDWADATGDVKRQAWLLQIARATDQHVRRNQLRDPAIWNKPEAFIDVVKTLDPGELSPSLLAVVASRLRKHHENAIPLLRAAQVPHPNDFWINFHLATALHVQRPSEAVEYYRAALVNRPRSLGVLINLSDVLTDLKRFDEAEKWLRKAISLAPVGNPTTSATLYANLGEVLRLAGELDDAEAAFAFAEKLDKTNPQAILGLGNVCLDRKQWDRAIAHYRRASQMVQRGYRARFNMALALHQKGDLDNAVKTYRALLKDHANFTDGYRKLAEALYDQRKYKDAISVYRQVLDKDPNDGRSWYLLGVTCAADDQLDEAIKSYRRAIRRNGHEPWYHHKLGLALQQQGKLETAVAAFRQAIAARHEFFYAWGALAQCLRDLERFGEARDATQQCLDVMPPGHSLRLLVADQLKQCRQLCELDQQLLAVRKQPSPKLSAQDSLQLANFCWRYKHLPRTAAQFYQQAFQKQPNLAEQQNEQHRYHAALAAMQAASGKGKDADHGNVKTRQQRRQQALRWLQDDLKAWQKIAAQPAPRLSWEKVLNDWLQHPDFTSVREPKQLSQLPKDEQQQWRRLWSDVRATLRGKQKP